MNRNRRSDAASAARGLVFGLLKAVALQIPQVRRLYEERRQFLVERDRLRQELTELLGPSSADLRQTIANLRRELDQHTLLIKVHGEHDARIPRGWTMGFLSTMPRSGTWYTFYFFEFLFSALEGRAQLKESHLFEVYPSASLAKVHVHSYCPGFAQAYHGSHREAWDKRANATSGFDMYDYGSVLAEDNPDVFLPARNGRVRIVYIYRNPLDQVVSHFFHAQKNKFSDLLPQCASPAEYLRNGALRAYAKQYFTFSAMKALFPANILMVRYEDLMRNPRSVFAEILAHWNFMLDAPERQDAFDAAIELAGMKNLRAREIALGRSLGGDKLDPGASHMSGGEISKWRNYYTQADIDWATSELAGFGLSLDQLMVQ